MMDSASLSLFDAGGAPASRMVPQFASAAIAAPALVARDYQQACDAAIDAHLADHRTGLVVMATGCGKTVIFSKAAAKRGGCLVLAHRDSLIKQAAAKLHQESGEYVAIEKAERTAFASNYIAASVQTLRDRRLREFAARFPAIRFIIIDEAHRATAKTYRDIVAAFPDAQILGVTATADRTDGVGMNNVFEAGPADGAIYRYEMGQAMSDGWLAPFKMVPVACKIDLRGIDVKGRGATRGYDEQQLEDAIAECAADNATSLLDVCGEHRLIGFTPGVKTAHATAGALNLKRPGCARAVDGEMNDQEKELIGRQHRDGEFQFLINCGVYIEGYDDATLDGIFDSAFTLSRQRAVQKWGRATRTLPGLVDGLATAAERRGAISASSKPWAVVYDLTPNMTRHDPVSPADDLLAGRATDDEIKRVKEKLRKAGGDVDGALSDVRAEMAADRAAVAARAAMLAARRRATTGAPVTIWQMIGRKPERQDHETVRRIRPEDRPEPWMLDWLRRRDVRAPVDMTRRDFFKLKGISEGRDKNGLANLASVERLGRYGISAQELPQSTAVRVLNAIAANHMHALPAAQLTALLDGSFE
jgi:superfamily II DNA or RNA helicase